MRRSSGQPPLTRTTWTPAHAPTTRKGSRTYQDITSRGTDGSLGVVSVVRSRHWYIHPPIHGMDGRRPPSPPSGLIRGCICIQRRWIQRRWGLGCLYNQHIYYVNLITRARELDRAPLHPATRTPEHIPTGRGVGGSPSTAWMDVWMDKTRRLPTLSDSSDTPQTHTQREEQ